MSDSEPDREAARNPAGDGIPVDRGETVDLMEPLLVSESSRHRTALTDIERISS